VQPIFSAAVRAGMSGTHGRTALPRGLLRLMAGTCLLLTLCSCESYNQWLDSLPSLVPAGETHTAAESVEPSAMEPAIPLDVLVHELARIDFRILSGHTRISRRDYMLASAPDPRPKIIPLGHQVYVLKMRFDRDSRSSLRGSRELETHFYYDGTELVFFYDDNFNNLFDRRDTHVWRYLIDHKGDPPREVEFESSDGFYKVTLMIVFDRRY